MRLAPVLCLLALLIGGSWLYFTPSAVVSIDINPSFELSLNRFDRVIGVTAYNEDAEALLSKLSLRNRSYENALDSIICSDKIASLLENDELLVLTVIDSGAQAEKLLLVTEQMACRSENISCGTARREDAQSAHSLGLSCGKYLACAELLELEPELELEDIESMTMREIRDLISDCGDSGQYGSSNGNGYGNGNGNGNGKAYGRG